jgi:hypothetical protein
MLLMIGARTVRCSSDAEFLYVETTKVCANSYVRNRT